MSLTDLMSGMGATIWQQVATIIFALAFVAIIIHVWMRSKADMAHCSQLPIDDGVDVPPGSGGGGRRSAEPGESGVDSLRNSEGVSS